MLSNGSLRTGFDIAAEIQQRVRFELGITVSIGVSYNKIFAKLGSDLRKPEGLAAITPENYKRLVWPLPAADLLGVGRATARKLESVGIHTIGDIATAPRDLLCDEDAHIVFYNLAESVAERLRDLGLKGRTVQISLRTTRSRASSGSSRSRRPRFWPASWMPQRWHPGWHPPPLWPPRD